MTLARIEHEANPIAVTDQLKGMVDLYTLYLKACEELLQDADYASISGKKFRKRTGWAKLRRAFNVSVEVIAEEFVERGDTWGYEFNVKATLPNGRYEVGDGACFSDEFSGGRIRATHHNVRAKALTRAKNRATSDILGAGDVSAEELIDGEFTVMAESKPQSKQDTRPVGGTAWVTDQRYLKRFWAWARTDLSLNNEQIHEALGVDSLKDYQGTPEIAKNRILDWITDQVDTEEAMREADVIYPDGGRGG